MKIIESRFPDFDNGQIDKMVRLADMTLTALWRGFINIDEPADGDHWVENYSILQDREWHFA